MATTDNFPFLLGSRQADIESLETFKEYDWDFEKNCFKTDSSGNMILLTGNDALKIWIQKALMVQRFKWLAYPDSYGIELYQLLGKAMSVGERRSELRRYIIESLMVNPYIKSVNSVELSESEHGRKLAISIDISTIYGELQI